MKAKIKLNAADVAAKLLKCKGTIYTFGNGGSASIADHMACDWMKLTRGRLKVISLSSNNALISAIANDISYEAVCEAQLRYLGVSSRDLVVLISASGMSPNIVRAAKYCNANKIFLVGFTGATKKERGGDLGDLCDRQVHCSSDDYGVVEDYHSQVMHEVARILVKS